MAEVRNERFQKQIWQNQGSERPVVPLGLLRNKLRQLHRKIVLQLAFATGVGLIALDLFVRGLLRAQYLMLMFLGLAVLSVRPVRQYYELFQRSGFPSLPPWLPIVVLLVVVWAIIAIIVNKKNRAWTQREFQVLESLEKENR